MTSFQFFFLGPAQFSREGRPVELTAAKAVALLAYLAVTGAAHSRDRLIDLLWPDSLPEAARKNLRNTLWTIRKTFGNEVLQAEADRLALIDAAWSDVHTFETSLQSLLAAAAPDANQLEAAIAAYRGPLLDGFNLADAPDFEIWLTGERERLGQLYLQGLCRLAALYKAAADWRNVIQVAQRALAHDNLQEPMYRILIEAHARLGERSEAQRHYQTLRAVLARELGVEPLPETEALQAAILKGELQPAQMAATVPARGQRLPPTTPHPDLPFIGRWRERAALDEELQLAAAGPARVVLLTGELGIGKSRLWQVWSDALPPQLTVLATHCLETTQALPFAPLVNLFRQQVCLEHLFKSPSPVPQVWLIELARLLPEIREHWPHLPASAVLAPEEERRRLFEAFTQTLRAVASRPLILFIDDLHWADRATLDWLVYFVDRLRPEPLLLVGAYRPNDASAELVQIVTGWSRAGLVRRLPLDQLTLEEATELVAALAGDVTQVAQLQSKSAGNPYFLIELSRVGPANTPAGLAELVHSHLRQLPQAVHQVLQAAAILEMPFDFATLRRTSGRSEEEVLDALDTLLAADVLLEREGKYSFAHPLVATIVHDDLSLARRSFLHRRAAEALEIIHAGQPASIAGQLAAHYEQAGQPAQAASYAELAAAEALKLSAPAEAAAFYQQALKLEPTPTRWLGWGQALFAQGDLKNGRAAMGRALAEFESQGNRRGAARACLALANSYLPSEEGEKMIHWAEKALPYLDAQLDPEAHTRIHFLLGAGNLRLGHAWAEAEKHLTEAIHLAVENNLPDLAANSRFELGNLLAERGDLTGALGAFEQVIELARSANDHALEVLGHNNLAYHALLAGDLVRAQVHIDTALVLAESYSFFLPPQYLYSTRGELALAQKQLDEAETWFRRGLAEANRYSNQLQAANIRAKLGLVAQARGDLDEALIMLLAARAEVAQMTAAHLQTQMDLWLAELYLQRGERTAAAEALAQAEGRLSGDAREGLQAWAGQVRAAL